MYLSIFPPTFLPIYISKGYLTDGIKIKDWDVRRIETLKKECETKLSSTSSYRISQDEITRLKETRNFAANGTRRLLSPKPSLFSRVSYGVPLTFPSIPFTEGQVLVTSRLVDGILSRATCRTLYVLNQNWEIAFPNAFLLFEINRVAEVSCRSPTLTTRVCR